MCTHSHAVQFFPATNLHASSFVSFRRHADIRAATFAKVLSVSEAYVRESKALLLRASLLKHDVVQRSAAGGAGGGGGGGGGGKRGDGHGSGSRRAGDRANRFGQGGIAAGGGRVADMHD